MTSSSADTPKRGKLGDLAYKMFLNAPVSEPDIIILQFIKKYIPFLAPKDEPGKWTAYGLAELPPSDLTVHSFVLTKHPYFDVKFRECRFDFLTREDKNKVYGLRDYHLWFLFDYKRDAEEAFYKLCQMFGSVCTWHTIFKKNNKRIAAFEETYEFKIGEKDRVHIHAVQFVLTEDELYDNRYKIFFRIGVDDLLKESCERTT